MLCCYFAQLFMVFLVELIHFLENLIEGLKIAAKVSLIVAENEFSSFYQNVRHFENGILLHIDVFQQHFYI